MEFSVCDLKSDEVQDANSEEDFSQREAQYAHSAKGSVDGTEIQTTHSLTSYLKSKFARGTRKKYNIC